MRIIRTSIVLLIIIAIFLSIVTVTEAEESNETKTNSKTNDKLIFKNDKFGNQSGLILAYEPDASQAFLEKITKKKVIKRTERDKALDRFEEKRLKANLPEGEFIINASAYTAAADECGKSDGITASGLKVKERETIACPREFPFGVKVNIQGMGVYTCQDRGGAIKGNKFDIYMETKAEAFAFGRQNLVAEVVS